MPRLLLAAAALYWGWRSGHWIAGAVLATLAEAPRSLRFRLDFSHEDLTRVATLCSAVFVVVLVALFATAEAPRVAYSVLTTLTWLPAILMPLLIAQQLSPAGRIPLSAMFRYVRKLKARNPAMPDPLIDIAPIWFALCVVAAGVPNQRDPYFFGGIVLLVAWALAAVRPAHVSLAAWAGTLATAAAIGFGAHNGMSTLQASIEDWIGEWFLRGMAFDPTRSTTEMGAVGRLKMIDAIVLRVYASDADAPRLRLLHRASFTTLSGNTWVARNAPLEFVEPLADGTTWRIAEGEPKHSVRIFTRLERGRAMLALPPGTVRVSDMAAAAVRRNPYGVMEAVLGGDWAPYIAEAADAGGDYAVPKNDDLQLPERERREIEALAAELGLRGRTPAAAIRRVEDYLSRFSYSTYRERPVPAGTTALADFLRHTRSGHCEYFAAATTLLLRAAGIPARYATGFALYEYSALESAYVARARHAHAWTRAFVDGRWIDVDTTPPTWFEAENERAPGWERLMDFARWTGFRWSQRGPLELGAAGYGVIFILLAVFAWRLTRVKRAAAAGGRTSAPRRAQGGGDSEFYPLERALAARHGTRSESEPLRAWLARVGRGFDPAIADALRAALVLHYRYRFDPAGIDDSARAALRAKCRAALASLH